MVISSNISRHDFFLTIAIPTKNRITFLENNLVILENIISKNGLRSTIEVIISDNNSNDGTSVFLREFIIKYNLKNFFIISHRNSLAGGMNSLSILKISRGKFIMFLGDDDYLSNEYILEVLEILKTGQVSTIITNSYQHDILTGKIKSPRTKLKNNKIYKHWLFSSKLLSRSNNLSGHVFKNVIYPDVNEIFENFNYPHIYLIGLSRRTQNTVYISKHPVKLTVGNTMAWNYDPIKYLENMFELNSRIAVNNLELIIINFYFIVFQGYHRIDKDGFVSFYLKVIKSNNILGINKIFLAFTILLDYLRLKIKGLTV